MSRVAGGDRPVLSATDCVNTLKQLGYERQRATVQHEIDRCQRAGTPSALAEIDLLLQKKQELLTKLKSLQP
ncbi:MAG TPA: hypothetical protein DIU48_14700 [Acidobacteria bacterium]|nr:hypothetical protein [Acidobacteriota bacterium]